MSSKGGGGLRPTERVLGNLQAINAQVQALGATRGGSAGSGMRGMGSASGGGTSRVSLTGGGRGLPELVNLQAMTVSLLTRLVDVTTRNGISDNPTMRASR